MSTIAQRLTLARNWTEFLRYAPRRPVAAEAVTTDVIRDQRDQGHL